MAPIRIFRIKTAFLPYRVTAAIGLPQHVAHANLLVVARSKRDAMRMIEPLRLCLGRDYHRLATTSDADADALRIAGLVDEAAIYAHTDITSRSSGHYLVQIKPGGDVERIFSMRDLHLCVDPPLSQAAALATAGTFGRS